MTASLSWIEIMFFRNTDQAHFLCCSLCLIQCRGQEWVKLYTFLALFLAQQRNASQGCLISWGRSHTATHHCRRDSSRRGISPSQRPFPLNTQRRQIWMPPTRFKPVIPASDWPQILALSRSATGIGMHKEDKEKKNVEHCTHTSESANVKTQRFNNGTIVICIVNSNYRIAATLYSLGTWFVSGI